MRTAFETRRSLAVSGCTNLRKAAIPEGVKTIEGGAFGGCSALCGISLPAVPELLKQEAGNQRQASCKCI